MIIGILPSTTNAFQSNIEYYSSKNDISTVENIVYTNPIQEQLYKMCQIELGTSFKDIIENYYVTKSDRQLDNDNIVSYNVLLKMPKIEEIIFQDNVQLEFYQNQLENVYLKFDMGGEKLKNFLVNKWGNPISSIAIADKIRYTWQADDYQARLFTNGNDGILIFYYMPYAKTVTKIKRLEYAEHLKHAPEAINRLENLVKNNLQFKESFKRELQNDPDYAQALQEAGMDMSIFN